MAMTPERVTERVDELIESIRSGSSHAFAEHNVVVTIGYIRQVYELGIIDASQFEALVQAVNDAADAWLPTRDEDGFPLDE
jgi:argininosuccinate lyase